MKQVTKDEFYAAALKETANIHPHIVPGEFPWNVEWKSVSGGNLWGMEKPRREQSQAWPIVTDYFISNP